MRYINEYREGDFCKGIYLCKSKQVLTARTGKTYYSLILQDKTGSVDCKVFDIKFQYFFVYFKYLIVKIVPILGVLLTVILPPSFSIIVFESERPMPKLSSLPFLPL